MYLLSVGESDAVAHFDTLEDALNHLKALYLYDGMTIKPNLKWVNMWDVHLDNGAVFHIEKEVDDGNSKS